MPTETVVQKFAKHAKRNAAVVVPLRVVALLLVVTAAPLYEAHHITAFGNADIWWHLRTGLWILQNHAVPHFGIFSQYLDRPWVDTNWGFDLLAAAAYKLLGMRAVPVLLMGFKFVLAAATFLLAYIARRNFLSALLLSAAAQYVIVDLQPLPSFFSILFFGVELILLLESRRTGNERLLFWLPLLFCCWANLHQQFVLGLLLLALFVLAGAAEQVLHRLGFQSFTPPALPVARSFAIAGITCVATLVNPYGIRLVPELLTTLYNKVQFIALSEMSSMEFRSPQNFVLMLLVMAAFFALGRRRSRDLFKLSMLGIFIMIAFRVRRDAWSVVLPAIAVIAGALPRLQVEADESDAPAWKWETPVVAVLGLIVLSVATLRLPNDPSLTKYASKVFPVKACDYLRASQPPGPMFNSYIWGGFLTWYLPEYPVAIDGRLNLYGDELNEKYFKLTGGNMRLEEDPSFSRARVILLERNSGLTRAMTSLPLLRQQFRVVYEDELAVVFVRASSEQ